jgi:hypothetical protein
MVRGCQPHAQTLSWRTTPCRLSAVAYSIYSQLSSIVGGILPSATRGHAVWWKKTQAVLLSSIDLISYATHSTVKVDNGSTDACYYSVQKDAIVSTSHRNHRCIVCLKILYQPNFCILIFRYANTTGCVVPTGLSWRAPERKCA